MKNITSYFRRYAFLLAFGIGCFLIGGLAWPLQAKRAATITFRQTQPPIDIDSVRAKRLIANHRNANGNSQSNRKKFGRTYYFSRSVLEAMLAQRDRQNQPSAGIRLYSTRDEDNEARLLLVSVAESGRDLLGQDPNPAAVAGTYRLVLGVDKCPENCTSSLLLPADERQ